MRDIPRFDVISKSRWASHIGEINLLSLNMEYGLVDQNVNYQDSGSYYKENYARALTDLDDVVGHLHDCVVAGCVPGHRENWSDPNVMDPDKPLFEQLSQDFQEQVAARSFLWKYLCDLPISQIGIPQYYEGLSPSMKSLSYRNLIYPVDQETYVHLYPGQSDARDYYIPIEPDVSPYIPSLIQEVDNVLIDEIGELRKLNQALDKKSALLKFLETVVKGGSLRSVNQREITQDEYRGLQYLLVRDKVGMGVLDPIINDSYVEDITCSGVGPIFVEHKVFGGLISSVAFDDAESLDHFVIKLSEKIGRPVTVREPLIDATLPDGARINIVYGDDISKRGSNFTIRKFNDIPLSILDLVRGGTLSYEMASYISLMLSEGMNTFVSGETASGKTTMMNAISTFINPKAKIVSIEDTPELQVPHDNWTREVVRSSNTGSASVTMFDLLKTALRQRPNEIIIGEIRGEEGAVAFQAMQTGHSCMSTFHASSVERLIQRLTGTPINIPKTYVDNLNVVIIMAAVKLPDGNIGRRVTSINEIIGYDSESNSYDFIEVFKWDPATDTFEFPGYLNTHLLENTIAARKGIAPHETKLIYDELEDRAQLLSELSEREVSSFYELHEFFSRAYREGYFR